MCCNQKTFKDTLIGCEDIRVNAILTPDTDYVWEVTTRFAAIHLVPFTTDSDGYGTINISALPDGFCVAGEKFTLRIKQTIESCEYISIPFIINHQCCEIEFYGGSAPKSFIGCPYTPPPGASFKSAKFDFVGDTDQTEFQDDGLIDAKQVIVFAESGLLQEGTAINQYQFDKTTGTITFGQSVEGQNVSIIYFK